jgi:copper chaperone
MTEITLTVTGMSCGGCVNSVQNVLKALPGVHAAEVSLSPGQAHVAYDDSRLDRAALVEAIVGAGFGVSD